MNITKEEFKSINTKQNIFEYTLTNKNGLRIKIINYGSTISSIEIPTVNGLQNIVLGFNNLDNYLSFEYIENCPYFGATIGRFANRINKGQFILNNKKYQLYCNQQPHHLHGGKVGFDKKFWDAEIIHGEKNTSFLKMTYISPDMEEAFPGNVKINIIYSLTEDNQFTIEYFAVTDKATPINITNHTYFNLTGEKSSILNHRLKINADKYLITDERLIPTGEIKDVANTDFDFRKSKTIKQKFDNSFVLNKDNSLSVLSSPDEKVSVEIKTTQPSMQLYTGYYKTISGIALEPQAFPDAPNHANFSSCVLNPNDTYYQKTKYKFNF
ncbi:MAG: galactose mutarotase [Bacteroidetes bacterium]|nr:galactose mutarotase [Bacteroidota bacterium]